MTRYKDANLENCADELQNSVTRAITEEKGIFIFGNTGVGKTYFCHAIANAKIEEVENFVSLLSEYRDYMQKGYYNDNLKDLCNKEYLIIDDIGSEKTSDFVIEFLYSIINKRYENMKRTVLTTNLQLRDFSDRYGDRILSRISEMCVLVELKGVDKRI